MINNSMYNFMVNNTSDYTRDSLTYFGNRISRGELLVLIDKFALYLNKCGIKKGDVVAVCLPNIPDAIIAIYAANKIGAVCNIIHPLTSANNILKTLSETKCRMLFISDFKYFKDIEELKKVNADIVISSISGFMKGFKKLIALFAERKYRSARTGEKYFTECLKEEVVQKQLSSKFNGDELAVLIHSGGTTGVPKTVMLSNRALNASAMYTGEVIGGETERTDGFLMVLPLFHGFGLGVCMHTVLCKNTNAVLVPKFNAKKTVKIIEKENVTFFAGVPAMYAKLMNISKFKSKKIMKKIKFVFTGGDKLKDRLKTQMDNALIEAGSKARMNEGYGLSEAVAVCTLNKLDNEKRFSVGQPLACVEIAIIDKKGNKLKTGQRGEIAIAGPVIMDGYLNDEENTKKTFIFIDGKKFVKTGDCGFTDEDGFLYFIDRFKRMIKISGYNVFPSEIENTVLTLTQVRNCAVVTKDTEAGVYFKLIVEPENDKIDLNKLKLTIEKLCQDKLIAYSVPREIEFVKNIPLTSMGKVKINN